MQSGSKDIRLLRTEEASMKGRQSFSFITEKTHVKRVEQE